MSAPAYEAVLHLRPSPRRWLGVLAICLVFVGIGLGLPGEGATFWIVNVVNPIFFGLGALIALAQFVPGVNGVSVDAEGLLIRSLGRRTRVGWGEVVGLFRPVRMPNQTLIGFDLAPPASEGRLARMNRATCGFHGALPDTYGMDPQDLADLLNRRLRAWRAARSGRPRPA
jgi:hypothetical protein